MLFERMRPDRDQILLRNNEFTTIIVIGKRANVILVEKINILFGIINSYTKTEHIYKFIFI